VIFRAGMLPARKILFIYKIIVFFTEFHAEEDIILKTVLQCVWYTVVQLLIMNLEDLNVLTLYLNYSNTHTTVNT